MNTRESKCVKILTDLVENEGLVGIKTSFEDEGATFNETVRLKQVCNEAKVKITLKIGGPEAIRDLKDSTIIGVKGIVAPMVESEFGLVKFLQATKTHISEDTLSSLQLNVNLETITAMNNSDKILSIPEVINQYLIMYKNFKYIINFYSIFFFKEREGFEPSEPVRFI